MWCILFFPTNSVVKCRLFARKRFRFKMNHHLYNDASAANLLMCLSLEKGEHFAEVFNKWGLNFCWLLSFPNGSVKILIKAPQYLLFVFLYFFCFLARWFIRILTVGLQPSFSVTSCLSNNYQTRLNHPLQCLLHLSLREDTHCWEVWEKRTEKQDSWWVGLQ